MGNIHATKKLISKWSLIVTTEKITSYNTRVLQTLREEPSLHCSLMNTYMLEHSKNRLKLVDERQQKNIKI